MSSTLQLWFGAFLLSFAPVFVKGLPNLGPTAIGFYRCAIAAVILLPFVRNIPAASNRRFYGLTLLSGLVFAIDLFFWHRSVIYVGAGIGTILGNTQIFYLAAMGILAFKERITLRFVVSVLMAVSGTILLVNPVVPKQAGDLYWLGVMYGLATGVAYAIYVILLRAIERLGVVSSLASRLMLVSAATALWLFPATLAEGGLPVPRVADWPMLLALSGLVQIGGWFLITRNLSRVAMSRVGLLLLTQPVGATAWGYLFFNEQLGTSQVLGALMTVVALYLGSTAGGRR